MFGPVPDIAQLEAIVRNTVAAIEASKVQIFALAEGARTEYRRVERELDQVKDEASQVIDQVDNLERQEQRARWRLVEVSREFRRFSEKDVRAAYEDAKNVQVELALTREREKSLRYRRDELERTLRNLFQTVQRAEQLVSQVGVVMDYLQGGLGDLTQQLEEVQQRQHLAIGVIKAQEEERRRVAREIHDGPAQSLANLVFRLELCEKLLFNQALEKLQLELLDIKTLTKDGLQDVRNIIFNLRPMALDDLGLIPALRRYLGGLQDREQLVCELVVLGDEIRLPSPLEVGIFRIIQEALNNVLKHARASSAKVAVSFTESTVMVSIKDDGVGFDFQQVGDLSKEGGHYGLIGMRERAELLNGRLEVKSAPGVGTKITLSIPLDELEGGGLGGAKD